MTRTKINYGIDLGTTNSAIALMHEGEIEIIKALPDRKKETTPSCVGFRRNGSLVIGDTAYSIYQTESKQALLKNNPINVFLEFKRTMGTDKRYRSTYMDEDFTSEDLSSQILKRLKEYVQDDPIQAAVITVPSAFKSNQIEATRKAAELAGLLQVDILQEPVAASMAYGLNQPGKDGYWLVFDFGGGTFDAALLHVDEGIMKVLDTEGDNYLGGKNLDYAIVDKLLLPYVEQNYTVNQLLDNEDRRSSFRDALKFFAEKIKNHLSFQPTYNLYVDPGDLGRDDSGEDIELDLTVTTDQLRDIVAPIYQKAVDAALELLRRNNLTGTSLEALILVGGPTLSPILRSMLETQIHIPDTHLDPMTVVAQGAALYASTVDLSEAIRNESRQKTRIQLEIQHESTSVEHEELVTLKILKEETVGPIPDPIYAEVRRGDHAWASGKIPINTIGDVIDVPLEPGRTNLFEVYLSDGQGNIIEVEPDRFTIIQGSVLGSATLPYHVGIEVQDIDSDKVVFRTIPGLEKNRSFPATGMIDGLKTQRQIRPGLNDDFLDISIYQGAHDAEGTRAIHNHHVHTLRITGEDLPALLPENSDVNLTLYIDRSQHITGKAFFPYLEFEHPFECIPQTDSIAPGWLEQELKKGWVSLETLKSMDIPFEDLENKMREIQTVFESSKDVDTQQQVLSNLRKILQSIDQLINKGEWPRLEEALKSAFYQLEEIQEAKGSTDTKAFVDKLQDQVEKVLQNKMINQGNQLLEKIQSLTFELERLEHLIEFITVVERDFEHIPWRDPNAAQSTLYRAKTLIAESPSIDHLQPLVNDLFVNARLDEQGQNLEVFLGILKG